VKFRIISFVCQYLSDSGPRCCVDAWENEGEILKKGNQESYVVIYDGERLASYLHNLINMLPRPKTKGPWMRIVEQEEKPSVSFEDVLEVLQAKQGNDTQPERAGTFLSGFPIATTVLGIMMVAIGIMAMILKSDIGTLKSDITDIKNLKTQIATLDPKIQLANIESKLEDMKKEKDVVKGEIAQLQTELGTIKTELSKEKMKAPSRLRNRPASTKNTVSDMKNIEVLLKKTPPQDGFSPGVSRAMSLDPPRK